MTNVTTRYKKMFSSSNFLMFFFCRSQNHISQLKSKGAIDSFKISSWKNLLLGENFVNVFLHYSNFLVM